MDYGHKWTDKELKKLEKRLSKEYKQALVEMEAKANAYFKKFQERDKKMLSMVNENKITQEEYINWRKGKVFINERYNRMVDGLAKDLTNTNQIAMGMIDKTLPNAYAMNYNYAGYEIAHGLNANIAFELVDHDTVERLVKDDPTLLPKPRVNISKDQKWNEKKINSALVQGILQGDSINHIADRLKSVTDMSEGAAIRNARTMTTGAENAGRQKRYEEAVDMGIDMEKMWIATPDSRTRDWHIDLDGVTIPVNESFVNSHGEIEYPGDPSADGANVYNCRCTLVSQLKGIKYDHDRWTRLGDMSFDEWRRKK